ncbi:hypothetical protein CH35J_010745 [Colletotrichum higginsianum]|uniref:Arrestin-like N-terminal domain-containing protein n=1 Tax=Colletotrichum higginsianum TaxID=80884 RepID=A0A4T0VJ67_9PEZI|nr:hypothetical protein CH35J_010745 [Colletotrichum higginsianum]
MSIRIALDNAPEFYTNLDSVTGRVVLHLSRPEQIGGIVVKLEGESKTALGLPQTYDDRSPRPGGGPGSIASENHKILYRVAQVFPTYEDDLGAGSASSSFSQSYMIQAGQHEFPFTFKLPLNNACSDPVAMSKIGGIGGMGGFGAGIGPFGLGGARVMDGSKQLFLQHVAKTLPPSFTGFPRQAEVRYYLKVTIQRPGFLKENWRYQIGFKFMPIEPPRPPKTTQEAFARRPFSFKPRPQQALQKKKSSLFGSSKEDAATTDAGAVPPSIELSARLPHPPILTCNQPLPLRLIAKKLVPSHEQVFLTSFQIELVGKTHVRCHDLFNTEVSKWVVATQTGLAVPILADPASDDLSLESVIPDDLWRNIPLPNTVAPSFIACNLQRHYELEIQLGLSWGKPPSPRGFLSSSKDNPAAQTIFLPLHFSKIQVYSGIAPPPQLLEALAAQASRPTAATLGVPPRLPPRTSQSSPATPTSQYRPGQQRPPAAAAAAAAAAGPGLGPGSQAPQYDPLYPPQIGTPGATGFDEAPPSYDEAMAANASGPEERPAYSGVTNENAPSQIPEKS